MIQLGTKRNFQKYTPLHYFLYVTPGGVTCARLSLAHVTPPGVTLILAIFCNPTLSDLVPGGEV